MNINSSVINESKEVKKWWDDDGDEIGYEPGEVSGKFKRKKKAVKEGYSNWREDLSEILELSGKDKNDKKIVEKKVNNKIKINPSIGESVKNLGGTLLEMTEIEDFEEVFDYLSESDIFFLTDELIEEVVLEVFEESIQEGYDSIDIENALLESLEISTEILNEAKVTYGHDTKIKRDRLEKVKTAVKDIGKKVIRAAGRTVGSAVKRAKSAGKEFKKGYISGRGDSSETTIPTDSSSSTSSTKSAKPGFISKIGSALKTGLKRAISKGARKVAKGALGVARKMEKEKPSSVHSKTGTRAPNIRSGIGSGKRIEVAGSPKQPEVKKVSVSDVTPKKSESSVGSSEKSKSEKQKTTEKTTKVTSRKPRAKQTTTTTTNKKTARKSEPNPKKPGAPSLDDLLKKEQVDNLIEKTLTSSETKKREELVKSMKKNLSDFEKRYPGRGKEVMYATATKMAKRMAEQALELEPKSQTTEKTDQQQKKMQQQRDKMRQQEIQILQRKLQALRSAPKGTDPSITA